MNYIIIKLHIFSRKIDEQFFKVLCINTAVDNIILLRSLDQHVHFDTVQKFQKS